MTAKPVLPTAITALSFRAGAIAQNREKPLVSLDASRDSDGSTEYVNQIRNDVGPAPFTAISSRETNDG